MADAPAGGRPCLFLFLVTIHTSQLNQLGIVYRDASQLTKQGDAAIGAKARVIKGKLVAFGSWQSQGGVKLYDFLRIQPSAPGVDGYLPKATTVPMTESLLNGNEKTFYIVPLKSPKVLGGNHFNMVYAVRVKTAIFTTQGARSLRPLPSRRSKG